MNAAQVHLALTHMPVILTITGLVILLVSLFIKKQAVTNTGLIVLIAAGVFAIPVFLSGEGAEEVVEEITGVTGSMIEEHEEIALFSFYAVLGTAILALIAMIGGRKKFFQPLSYMVVIFALVTSGLMAYTAHLGGQIRHTEIAAGQLAAGNDTGNDQGEEEDD